jgi:hypothetical protein
LKAQPLVTARRDELSSNGTVMIEMQNLSAELAIQTRRFLEEPSKAYGGRPDVVKGDKVIRGL